MRFYNFKKPNEIALELSQRMFGLDKWKIRGFFRRSLNNMLDFWNEFEKAGAEQSDVM